MLVPYPNILSIDKLKVRPSSEFEKKDLGEAKRILGMEIKRDMVKEKVNLTQKAYLQKVLQKFNVGCEIKSVSTFFAPHFKF